MAGIYIHIPFCKRKCIYCDFYSIAPKDIFWNDYARLLLKEFTMRRCELAEPVRTVYFGGGTPSLMPLPCLTMVLHALSDGEPVEEATIEVNPDDITESYAAGIRDAGFNRVSMGVQSFVNDELRFLRRRHDADGAERAVRLLQESGIYNISIDLIYGIPGQTAESWRQSIRRALSLGVPHISAYNLTYEEGTLLTLLREKGKIKEMDDAESVQLFDILTEELHAGGFEQYEISNFAIPGMYSRHNSGYWAYTPYLGLGPSAHSFDGRTRRWNPGNFRDYVKSIETFGVAFKEEKASLSERYNEWVMLRLRTKWGLDIEELYRLFGKQYAEYALAVISKYIKTADLEKRDGCICLTHKGVMVSDAIFRDLFIV